MQNSPEFFLGIEAVLTIGEIKTAVHRFDEGDTNAFATLDAVIGVIASYQAKCQPHRKAA